MFLDMHEQRIRFAMGQQQYDQLCARYFMPAEGSKDLGCVYYCYMLLDLTLLGLGSLTT